MNRYVEHRTRHFLRRRHGHAQGTPLEGLRFETLAAAQAYLDHWETR
jgi:hypothetical protein